MKIPFLQKLSAKEKRLLYITLGIGGLCLIYLYLIEPAFTQLKDLEVKIKQIKEQKEADDLIRVRKERILKDYEIYQPYMTPPADPSTEIQKLSEFVNNLAHEAQITLNNLKTPSDKECRLILDCEGNITALIKFTYDLSYAKILLKIEKIDMSLKAPKEEIIKCTITMSRAKLF